MCAVTLPVAVRQLFFLPDWNKSPAKISYIADTSQNNCVNFMVGRFLRKKWMSESIFFLFFQKSAYFSYPELSV
jgi:hypothetical protein